MPHGDSVQKLMALLDVQWVELDGQELERIDGTRRQFQFAA